MQHPGECGGIPRTESVDAMANRLRKARPSGRACNLRGKGKQLAQSARHPYGPHQLLGRQRAGICDGVIPLGTSDCVQREQQSRRERGPKGQSDARSVDMPAVGPGATGAAARPIASFDSPGQASRPGLDENPVLGPLNRRWPCRFRVCGSRRPGGSRRRRRCLLLRARGGSRRRRGRLVACLPCLRPRRGLRWSCWRSRSPQGRRCHRSRYSVREGHGGYRADVDGFHWSMFAPTWIYMELVTVFSPLSRANLLAGDSCR